MTKKQFATKTKIVQKRCFFFHTISATYRRHCAERSDKAIQENLSKSKSSGLLRYARKDGWGVTPLWFLPFCLAGCMGVYEGGFECPPGEGVGCKSISAVNEMVNQGELPKPDTASSPQVNERDNACETCGHSFQDTPEKQEIWINPLYLRQQKERYGKDTL